jgi:hypothetical protein
MHTKFLLIAALAVVLTQPPKSYAVDIYSETATYDTNDVGNPTETAPPATEQTTTTPNNNDGGSTGATTGGSCKASSQIANISCNTMKFLGLSSSESAMAEMALGQLLPMMLQASSGGADSCKKAADMNKLISIITIAKTTGCGFSINSCIEGCTNEKNSLQTQIRSLEAQASAAGMGAIAFEKQIVTLQTQQRTVEAQIAACEGYKKNAALMVMQTLLALRGFSQAKACVASTTSITPTPSPTPSQNLADLCKDAAYAATQPLCGTTNKINNGSAIGTGYAGGGSALGTSPYTKDEDPLAGSNAVDPNASQGKNAQNNTIPGGGGGGPSGGGFGSGGGGAGNGEGGAAASGVDKNVISGVSGGGGGGAFGGGGGGGYGAGAGGGGKGGMLSGLMDKFNLSKFLPKKKDFKQRGIAGMSVAPADGITGPMGPSLFEKVTSQYQRQKGNLLQDK